MEYLFLDARYEHVRTGGTVVSCALLVAMGITPEGRRTILGLSVSLSEAKSTGATFWPACKHAACTA